MTIVKCDMCGVEIPEVAFRVYEGGAHRFESDKGSTYDFCNNCYKNLREYVKTYFAAIKSGTAVPLTEEKK